MRVSGVDGTLVADRVRGLYAVDGVGEDARDAQALQAFVCEVPG